MFGNNIFYSLLIVITVTSVSICMCIAASLPVTGIIGGHHASPGQFPFMASIQVDMYGWRHNCGGSLISDRFVLTAAHCIESLNEMNVMVGAHNRSDLDEPHQVFEIEEVFKHPNHTQEDVCVDDIALIKLKNKLIFKLLVDGFGSVAKINLNGNDDHSRVGSRVLTAGWGVYDMKNIMRPASKILKYDEYKVIETSNCFENEKQVKDGIVCVQMDAKIKSAAFGDSGGPLFVYDAYSNDVYQVGISSCLANGRNGEQLTWNNAIYTKVSSYINWIESITGELTSNSRIIED